MMYCKTCGYWVFEICPNGVCKSCNGYTLRYPRGNLNFPPSNGIASKKSTTRDLESKQIGRIPLPSHEGTEIKEGSDSRGMEEEAQWAVRVIMNDTDRLDQRESGDIGIYNAGFQYKAAMFWTIGQKY
jgi:hypothetical protein